MALSLMFKYFLQNVGVCQRDPSATPQDDNTGIRDCRGGAVIAGGNRLPPTEPKVRPHALPQKNRGGDGTPPLHRLFVILVCHSKHPSVIPNECEESQRYPSATPQDDKARRVGAHLCVRPQKKPYIH